MSDRQPLVAEASGGIRGEPVLVDGFRQAVVRNGIGAAPPVHALIHQASGEHAPLGEDGEIPARLEAPLVVLEIRSIVALVAPDVGAEVKTERGLEGIVQGREVRAGSVPPDPRIAVQERSVRGLEHVVGSRRRSAPAPHAHVRDSQGHADAAHRVLAREPVHVSEIHLTAEVRGSRIREVPDSVEAAVGTEIVERVEPGAHLRDPLSDEAAELDLAVSARIPDAGQGDARSGPRELRHGHGGSEQLGRELEPALLGLGPAHRAFRNVFLDERPGRLDSASDHLQREEGHAEGKAKCFLPRPLVVGLRDARARVGGTPFDLGVRGRDPRGITEAGIRLRAGRTDRQQQGAKGENAEGSSRVTGVIVHRAPPLFAENRHLLSIRVPVTAPPCANGLGARALEASLSVLP